MRIKIISKNGCTECERIKFLAMDKGLEYEVENMDLSPVERQFELRNIARKNRQLSMPMVFIEGVFIPTSEFESEYLRGE